MGKIKEIIDNFEKEFQQPFRISRRDEHIAAAEELTKDEKIDFAFLAKRQKTNNYSVVSLSDSRIAVVQSTLFGRPTCYSIPWISVTGLDVYQLSKLFSSASIRIEHKGGTGSLSLLKVSKYAIYDIEKIILGYIQKNADKRK